MKVEEQNEKLIEKKQKENKKKKEQKRESTPTPPEQDEFFGYTNAAKYQLFILFFLLGIINHLGTILVMRRSSACLRIRNEGLCNNIYICCYNFLSFYKDNKFKNLHKSFLQKKSCIYMLLDDGRIFVNVCCFDIT